MGTQGNERKQDVARRMGVRLTPDRVKHIENLIASGESIASIKARTGLSRTTISDIKNRKHPVQAMQSDATPYERCPGCGGMVIMPCFVCNGKGKEPMVSESSIQSAIIIYLESQGGWVLNVAGGPEIKRGTPDLLACVRGRFWGIEVKKPGEVPTPIQVRRLQQIARTGGLAFFWESVDQAASETEAVLTEQASNVHGPGTIPHLLKLMERNR